MHFPWYLNFISDQGTGGMSDLVTFALFNQNLRGESLSLTKGVRAHKDWSFIVERFMI